MTAPFPLLDVHEALLQPLLQGHRRTVIAQLPQHADTPLYPWFRAMLTQKGSAHEHTHLPAEHATCWQGWQAYYAGNYHQAWQHFLHGQQLLQQHSGSPWGLGTSLPVELALGLAKVYVRVGYWHTSRQWTLHALALARKADRLFDCVRCYGALGELLLRAGHPQQALFCLGTSHRLLPPGAGERSRQWNYLASALLRLGTEAERQSAESLLMSSFYLSQDDGDANSTCHALARLQFLALDRNQNHDAVTTLRAEQLPEHASEAVPKGFLSMGRGLAAWRRADRKAAQQYARQASQHFQNNHGEYLWAASFCRLLNIPPSPCPASAPPITPDITPAPASLSPVDSLWQRIPLQDTGPTVFAPPADTMARITEHRKVFFL